MKENFKLVLVGLAIVFFIFLAKLFVYSGIEKKTEATEPAPVEEGTTPTAPALPSTPKGEKLIFWQLPSQDTTIVFKVPFLDEIKTSEIRNNTNAVMIWKSKGKSTFQIIMLDKYPSWRPNVSGGTFKLKNGKTLTVKFENEPRPAGFPSALDPDAWK